MCYRPSQPRPSHHRPRWGIYSLVRASVAFHFCCPCCRFHLSLGHRRRRLSRGHHRRRRRRTDSVASIGPLLAVSRTSAVPLSNSLDIIAADTDTKCRVPCLHLVFGKAMKMVYSMWSSSVNPAVRISAARSSILPISSIGLLPGAILKLSRRRENLDLPPVV